VELADMSLQCRECGATFVWTAGEQAFYAEKGLQNQPARCPTCRAARKAARLGLAPGEKVEHPVVCAECGAETTVPFIPRNGKPVYCSDCFDRVRKTSAVVP
jgi:CxxC-x17-CxxC domain-containing protein